MYQDENLTAGNQKQKVYQEQSTDARPRGEVDIELATFEKATHELGSRISQLGDRLQPILRADGLKEAGATPEAPLTTLASAIRARRKEVDQAIALLSSITERLEL